MSPEKKISKRQARRELRKRQEKRNRIIAIGAIVIGAVVIAGILINASLPKPVGSIATVEPRPRFMANDNAMGNPNAPIRLEEFSDYQCPYCDRFYKETETQLEDAYVATGKVYFVYRSFGAFIGSESKAAAEAAYCAGDQNKYWEYHDILFANQTGENVGDFSNSRLQAFAETLGLDMNAFNSCFNSNKYSDRVDQDSVDGTAAGVQATPSFVMSYTVNGQQQQKLIEGAQAFSQFQQTIDAALTEMGVQ